MEKEADFAAFNEPLLTVNENKHLSIVEKPQLSVSQSLMNDRVPLLGSVPVENMFDKLEEAYQRLLIPLVDQHGNFPENHSLLQFDPPYVKQEGFEKVEIFVKKQERSKSFLKIVNKLLIYDNQMLNDKVQDLLQTALVKDEKIKALETENMNLKLSQGQNMSSSNQDKSESSLAQNSSIPNDVQDSQYQYHAQHNWNRQQDQLEKEVKKFGPEEEIKMPSLDSFSNNGVSMQDNALKKQSQQVTVNNSRYKQVSQSRPFGQKITPNMLLDGFKFQNGAAVKDLMGELQEKAIQLKNVQKNKAQELQDGGNTPKQQSIPLSHPNGVQAPQIQRFRSQNVESQQLPSPFNQAPQQINFQNIEDNNSSSPSQIAIQKKNSDPMTRKYHQR
eukprot:403366789